MKRTKFRLTPEEVAYLASQYPFRSNEDIAEEMGISVHTVRSRADKHKWHKDKEYVSKITREIAIRCRNADRLNTPEAIAKRAETMCERYKLDKMRMKWGLEPLNKGKHYTLEPRAKLLQRNRLERLGYVIDKNNNIAYYHSGTKRAKRLEAIPRGTKKGSIRSYYEFKPLQDGKLDSQSI